MLDGKIGVLNYPHKILRIPWTSMGSKKDLAGKKSREVEKTLGLVAKLGCTRP